MIAIKDLLAILDKIPAWKELTGLPARVRELERKLAQLETEPTEDTCPRCKKKTLELTSNEPCPDFGFLGASIRTYTCSSCGFSEKQRQDV